MDDFTNLRHPHIALLSLFPEWLSLIKQVWVKRAFIETESRLFISSLLSHIGAYPTHKKTGLKGEEAQKALVAATVKHAFKLGFKLLPDPNHVRNHARRKLAKSPSPGLDGRMRATCSATLIGGPYNESSGSPGRSLSSVNTD